MGKYGFIFVGEHLLSCGRGLVSRKLKTPFVLPDERQKDLCWADWTSSRFSWILWCSDSTPSSPESSIHLDIHRAWQNFAAIMIDLDIRNSKFSRAILVSLELSIVLILTKYVRAVTLFICRWTVFNSFKFVKVISVIFTAFNSRELFSFLLATLSSCHKTLTVRSPNSQCCSSWLCFEIWNINWDWLSLAVGSCLATISVRLDILVLDALGFLFVASEVTNNGMDLVILSDMLKSTFPTH